MTSHWFSRLLPLIGPLLLFVLWQLAVSAQWLNPVLLPSPLETLGFMFQSFSESSMRTDIASTLYRRSA